MQTERDCTGEVESHAYHSCRDCYGRQMTPGTYMMTRPGHKPLKVVVTEDELSGDLGFSVVVDNQAVQQRVEDCAANVTFSRISEAACEAERLLESMRQILNGADEARRDLDSFESELCELLGCAAGDGSHLADLAMAAVRDGMGTPYGLLQAAGKDVSARSEP